MKKKISISSIHRVIPDRPLYYGFTSIQKALLILEELCSSERVEFIVKETRWNEDADVILKGDKKKITFIINTFTINYSSSFAISS